MIYRREIDGLRAVALLPVILFHAGARGFDGGYIGVDVFFVISGYLITAILVAEHSTGTFSLPGFYERRARRILPALFTVLLVCLPFAWLWMLPNLLQEFGQSLIAVSTFVSNIFFMRLAGYFDAPADLKPLLHTWSLAVEEQFYVFFPLLLALLFKAGRRVLILTLVAIAVLSLALAQAGGNLHAFSAHPGNFWDWPDKTQEHDFYFTPSRAWELLAGALVALYHAPQGFKAHRPAIAQLGSAAGLALIAWSVIDFDRTTPTPGITTLVPVIGSALVILFADGQTWAGRLLGHRWLVGIGLISYSAYLWHQPLFAFARIRDLDVPGVMLMSALVMLTFVLAALTWRYVEQPFRERSRFSRKAIFGAALAMTAVMIGVGTAAGLTRGFANRPSLSRLDQFLPEDIAQCAYPTKGYRRLLCSAALMPVAPGNERILLFVGDSLLSSARDGILAAARRQSLSVNFASAWGCPVLIGISRRVNGKPVEACSEFTRDIYQLIRDEKVTDVVLYAAYNRYLRVPQPGHDDLKAGRDAPQQMCRTANECIAQTGDALMATVQQLQAWQVRVWLVRQPPDYSVVFDKANINQRFLFGGVAAVQIPLAAYRADSRRYDLTAARTTARILDISSGFCDRLNCAPMLAGRMAYFDNDHLGSRGTLLLTDTWESLLKSMLAAP